MTVIEYAKNLAILSRWSADQASDAEASEAWSQLTAAGFTTVAQPAKKNWPTQVRRPDEPESTWGGWGKLVAALGPLGFLFAALGDDEFSEDLRAAVTAGRNAVSGGLPIVAVAAGVGVLAYLLTRRRR